MTDRTEREGLRECPFCGDEAALLQPDPGRWFVTCSECPAQTLGGSCKEQEISAWNRRPTEALAGKGGGYG